jgi:hypothetical protein
MNRQLSRWVKYSIYGFILAGLLTIACAHFYIRFAIVDMPGSSYEGIPTEESVAIAGISSRLKKDVLHLADEIGGRSIYNVDKLNETRDWIADRFRELGKEPSFQYYQIEPADITLAIRSRNEVLRKYGRTDLLPDNPYNETQELANLWIEFEGNEYPEQTLVVGAHYDTVAPDCPGADDNSTGIAGLLEVARQLNDSPPKVSIMLVAFTCEEYPIGGIDKMGSSVFVNQLLEQSNRQIVGMISLEMLGYYSNESGSQKYPAPFNLYFPDTANFIGFVGNASSRKFIRSVVASFRAKATIPSEGVAAPIWLAPDVLRSDHAPFILNGIPGLMVTDTSNFRYGVHLHKATDTPNNLDFTTMAHVVDGMCHVIQGFED